MGRATTELRLGDLVAYGGRTVEVVRLSRRPSGAFRVTGRGDGVEVDWSVTGADEFEMPPSAPDDVPRRP